MDAPELRWRSGLHEICRRSSVGAPAVEVTGCARASIEARANPREPYRTVGTATAKRSNSAMCHMCPPRSANTSARFRPKVAATRAPLRWTCGHHSASMAEADTGHDHDSHYEEVLLSDMDFDEEEGMYYWECPCGDMFEISQAEIDEGQDIAHCPSCSLTLRVLLPPPAAAAETTDPEVSGVVKALTGLSTKEGGT